MTTDSRQADFQVKPECVRLPATELPMETVAQSEGNIKPENHDTLQGKFGRYHIERIIGTGGMGEVYLAHDTVLDRKVALKFPKFRDPELSAQRERFRREAKATAALRHVGICPVYDVGEADGRDYLSMAYVEGQTVSELIKKNGPLPASHAAKIVRQVALAMAHAHDHGFVHRDLKPDNIVIEKESQTPIVLDFGLAKRLPTREPMVPGEGNQTLTEEGTILGTPAYMSPEQFTGDLGRIGPSADIYSLGLILYELLSGKRAYRGRQEVLQATVRNEMLEAPGKLQPGIVSGLDKTCLRACAKMPEDRFTSMAEFATALEPYCKDQAPPSRRPWLVAMAAAGGLAAAVLLGIIVFTFTTSEGTVRVELSDAKAPVEIKLDGQTIQLSVDGKPLKVKPGPHQFTVTGNGFETTTTEFTAKAGEQATIKLTVVPTLEAGKGKPEANVDVQREIAKYRILIEEAQQKHDLPGAIRYASELLLIDPTNQEILLLRGQSWLVRKEWDKAMVDFSKCLQLNPKNIKALYQRGSARYELGQVKEGLTDLDSALKYVPDFHAARLKRSWISGALGDHQGALNDCNQVITRLPESADAYWQRASIQFTRGDYPAAQKDMQTAMRFDSKYRNQFPVTLPDPSDWTPGDASAPALTESKSWDTPRGYFTNQVKVSPDGSVVGIFSTERTVQVVDYHSGKSIIEKRTPTFSKLAFRQNNLLLYTIDSFKNAAGQMTNATIHELDTQSGKSEKVMAFDSPGQPHTIALSPDETILASAGWNLKPHLWDMRNKKLVGICKDCQGVVEGAVFTRDGRYLITSAWDDLDRPVRMWDVITQKEVRHFAGHVGGSVHLALSKDGTRLLTCGLRDRSARLWDVETGKELLQLRHPTGIVRVALSPDGRLALTISGWRHNPDGSVHSLDNNNPFPMIWPLQKDHVVRLWDLREGRVIGRYSGPKEMYAIDFMPNGRQAVVGPDRKIVFLDVAGRSDDATPKK